MLITLLNLNKNSIIAPRILKYDNNIYNLQTIRMYFPTKLIINGSKIGSFFSAEVKYKLFTKCLKK